MPSKMERKFGKYAIPNLTLYLIIGYVIGYIMSLISPEVYAYFSFDPYLIFHGQIWRLFTWILTVPEELGIFTVIMMLLYYSLGTTLERTWGTYRYNVYMLSGFLFTVVGAIILYLVLTVYYSTAEGNMIYSSIIAQTMGQAISAFVSTYYINMSIFLAFAVTYPDMELLLYFIIPIKIKWFGFLYGGYIIYDIIYAFMNYPTILAVVQTTMIVLSLLNFLLYWFSGSRKRLGNMRRKREYVRSVQKGVREKHYENGAMHRCAVCGRTDRDYPELTFRYCSKCTGGKEYCQEHLFTHVHQ